MNYSKKVMDHFSNPRNVGVIDDADGVGEVGNPVCGDMMTFYIKVKDDKLEDVKFQTFGCGAAIAVSSMISEMAKGKTIDEALSISNKSVAEELGGLPHNKMHCSNLGADALQKAIENYKSQEPVEVKPLDEDKQCPEKEHMKCPYCGSHVDQDYLHVEECALRNGNADKKENKFTE
jgi:nitrogen fixation NifU-like protein